MINATPPTNRGVEPTLSPISFKCDYFSVTIHEDFNSVFTHLIPYLFHSYDPDKWQWGEFFRDTERGGRCYQRVYFSDIGITLYCQPVNAGQNHCHIEIKGKAIESIGQIQLIEFIRAISETYLKWNVTRFDGAFDHSHISPGYMVNCENTGAFRTQSRSFKLVTSTVDGKRSSTYYVGSRSKGSERLLRVYDMRGYNRVELELRKNRADLVVKDLLKYDHDSWSSRFLCHLRDFVDVIDPLTGSGNKSRADLCPLWSDFIKASEAAKIRFDIERPSLQRTQNWIEKSVITSLATLLESKSVDMAWLVGQIEVGRSKMSSYQRLLVTSHLSSA